MTKIQYKSRQYNVKFENVVGFCTYAYITVGSRRIVSRDCPYGFRQAAIENLQSRVNALLGK